MQHIPSTRRQFLARTAGVAGALLSIPAFVPARALGAEQTASANSRINIGMIGMGRQAFYANLQPFLASRDTQVVAVCDVDALRRERAIKRVEDYYSVLNPGGTYKDCRGYEDFREVLARKDIDAVMISTPDHWHVYMAIEAAKAGKDVSLEKPISLSITQGRALANAMQRHQRIFRTDTEVRTETIFKRACELARNGKLGKLKRIIAGVPNENTPLDNFPPATPVPPELNYELWLGPAPAAPYTEQRVHPRLAAPNAEMKRPGWMQIEDYSLGMILNWGAHLLDIVQWGNNTERTGPVEVEGKGTYPKANLWNVLQGFEIKYRYADGVEVLYTMAGRPFVRFEGTDGWVEAQWWKKLEAHPKELLDWKADPDDIRLPLINEKTDFIQAVKSRKETLIPAEIGHRTASMCQLGHIAIQLGRKLKWDPQSEQFQDDVAANQLLKRPMRAPWQIAGI